MISQHTAVETVCTFWQCWLVPQRAVETGGKVSSKVNSSKLADVVGRRVGMICRCEADFVPRACKSFCTVPITTVFASRTRSMSFSGAAGNALRCAVWGRLHRCHCVSNSILRLSLFSPSLPTGPSFCQKPNSLALILPMQHWTWVLVPALTRAHSLSSIQRRQSGQKGGRPWPKDPRLKGRV